MRPIPAPLFQIEHLGEPDQQPRQAFLIIKLHREFITERPPRRISLQLLLDDFKFMKKTGLTAEGYLSPGGEITLHILLKGFSIHPCTLPFVRLTKALFRLAKSRSWRLPHQSASYRQHGAATRAPDSTATMVPSGHHRPQDDYAKPLHCHLSAPRPFPQPAP